MKLSSVVVVDGPLESTRGGVSTDERARLLTPRDYITNHPRTASILWLAELLETEAAFVC